MRHPPWRHAARSPILVSTPEGRSRHLDPTANLSSSAPLCRHPSSRHALSYLASAPRISAARQASTQWALPVVYMICKTERESLLGALPQSGLQHTGRRTSGSDPGHSAQEWHAHEAGCEEEATEQVGEGAQHIDEKDCAAKGCWLANASARKR